MLGWTISADVWSYAKRIIDKWSKFPETMGVLRDMAQCRIAGGAGQKFNIAAIRRLTHAADHSRLPSED